MKKTHVDSLPILKNIQAAITRLGYEDLNDLVQQAQTAGNHSEQQKHLDEIGRLYDAAKSAKSVSIKPDAGLQFGGRPAHKRPQPMSPEDQKGAGIREVWVHDTDGQDRMM